MTEEQKDTPYEIAARRAELAAASKAYEDQLQGLRGQISRGELTKIVGEKGAKLLLSGVDMMLADEGYGLSDDAEGPQT